jgi:hypothetical protein
MNAYRRRYGVFAKAWHELGFSYVVEFFPYQSDDPAQFPTKQGGARWRPLGSDTTYVITRSGKDGFTIEAQDAIGTTLHLVTEDTSETRFGVWP